MDIDIKYATCVSQMSWPFANKGWNTPRHEKYTPFPQKCGMQSGSLEMFNYVEQTTRDSYCVGQTTIDSQSIFNDSL